VLGCAIISVVLMVAATLKAPLVLMILFVAWTLAPFIGMMALMSKPQGMIANRRRTRCTLAISVASVMFYGFVLISPLPTPHALPYLLWPALSWLIVAGTTFWMLWSDR